MAKSLIALVGVGYWGKNLLRVFNKLGAVKIFCDIDKNVLNKRKKEYPKIGTTTDFNEILNDKDIKGVVIATSAPTHYRLARRAIIAGKDVLLEKPMCLKLKEGEKLLKLAKKKRRILMVDHLFLYHPALPKIKGLLKKERLGEIYYIYSSHLNLGIIRTGENVLWSLSPHHVSLIIEIVGNLPSEVSATGEAYLNNKTLDVATANLKFKKSKTVAKFFISWLYPFKERKLIIIGSKGMLVFDDLAKDKIIIYDYKVKWGRNKRINTVKATTMKSEGKIVKIANREPLTETARDFLGSIKTRKEPKANAKQACDILRILEACQKSIKKNGKLTKI